MENPIVNKLGNYFKTSACDKGQESKSRLV